MSLPKLYLLAAAFVIPTAAQATTLFPQKFVCPIGGEKFTANVIGSMSSWGQRPDGRRYGTTPIVPLTECPKNGFVFFDEKFSKVEIEKMAPLVLGSEYQAMRKSETPHYRAWWLMTEIGRDSFDRAFMLLVSSWEADGDATRKVRYQHMFIEAAKKLPWSEQKRDDWFWINLRAANALRELGKFDDSGALLESLDSPDKLPKESDALNGARYLIDGLKQLNAERNAALEPANLIPSMPAADRCISGADLSAVETKACEKAELQEAIETLKKVRQQTN